MDPTVLVGIAVALVLILVLLGVILWAVWDTRSEQRWYRAVIIPWMASLSNAVNPDKK